MKTILEELKAKGIAVVEITFDGAGDSGDIECWRVLDTWWEACNEERFRPEDHAERVTIDEPVRPSA